MDPDRRWRAWLAEEAKAEIERAAAAAHPRETGGVLVGVIAGRRPWVTDALEIASARSGLSFYELPAGRRHSGVIGLRRRDPRLGYLGEWHTHPADVGPSATDVVTMLQLAADTDAGCPRPLLVIARRVGERYELDARQFHGRSLRVVRLLASGPLPARPEMPLRPTRANGLLGRARGASLQR